MHTIQQLRSGDLQGIKKLTLRENLSAFPDEIFQLADTLEVLDLSGNKLDSIPPTFPILRKLKILFLSDNLFTEFPKILSQCPELEMIGFKSNKIQYIPEDAFPPKLRWLILTNNEINEIPLSIGNCERLQKVMFAGNRLTSLPLEMSNCKNIELLRISANRFEEIPEWLFSMPNLSWLALGGNPCTPSISAAKSLLGFEWEDIEIKEKLGEGASGIISKAIFIPQNKEIAIKIFKGEVTSDGWPLDEMEACVAAGNHPNLVNSIGKIETHPEGKMGLVFELIPSDYLNLGLPPNFDTCTRDVFNPGTTFSLQESIKIAFGVANAAQHLHTKNVTHADLYAHNVLYHKSHALFGDFGAAYSYQNLLKHADGIEKIEIRAWGCLLEDLLQRTEWSESQKETIRLLNELKWECLQENVTERPLFASICKRLNNLSDPMTILN